MPFPDSRQHLSSSVIPRVATLVAILACFALIEWVASFHILASLLPLPSSLSIPLAWLFEHHIWQFVIGMTAITILSRGHLWSYGINSSDIRISMSVLLKFYAVALIVMIGLVVMPMIISGSVPEYFRRMGKVNMIGWILFQWMATAVADEILFHGLFQTLLLKYWREKVTIGSFDFPVAILFTSVVFAAGRTNVPVYGGQIVEYILALLMGLYGGIVYYRTRSLLTPMLSQAFFYGLPFVIRFAYAALLPT
ncbi:MAG: CPBP family intramembrane glutamic endopeptidase [Bacteroidota bacterium]